MKKEWPTQLTIRLIKRTGASLPNYVLFVVVYATKKNDYSFGPFLTDFNGEVVLSKKYFEEQIASTRSKYPMDYSDSLAQCQRKILVSVESRQTLSGRWAKLKEFYPSRAEELRLLIDRDANFVSEEINIEVNLENIKRMVEIEIG